MTDNVRKVSYWYATAPNKPGEGARVLNALKDGGVNLLAFHAFPSGRRAQLDFVPEDEQAFRAAARRGGIELSGKKTAFLVDGDDRPGVAADLLDKLATAGVNVVAMDGVCTGDHRYGLLFWVKPAEVNKASKALGIA